MELLMITAIKEFEDAIKSILKNSEVVAFSYMPVAGYSNGTSEDMQSNWFARDKAESDSVLFYAFVAKNNAKKVLKEIENFNQTNEVLSKIHAAVLDIKDSNII
jgi:nitrogen regulatory protein PII